MLFVFQNSNLNARGSDSASSDINPTPILELDEEKLPSRPSPLMERRARGLRGVVERKGCVAKVMSSAEW